MKKRFLSLLCVLALCLGLLPVTALAAENDRPYSLYVGNTDVAKTEYSDNAAYWTSSDGGTNWTSQLDEPTADSYIHYDGNGTLTLHNVNISRSNENGIYAEAMSGSAVSLTIQLEGTNTVSGWSGIFVHAVDGAASLSISGTGSLTAEGTGGGSFSGIQVQSNDGKAELTINNVDVTATNNVTQGIILRSGGSSTASLTVNGGELTASGSDAGIKYVFGSSGTGDGTPTVTVSDNAIVRANGGISDDSSTDIQIGADSNESNGGIVFDGKNGTVYGAVTLQEDITIGEGESLTIGDRASLDTNGKLTVNGGTLNGTPSGDVTYKVTGVSLNKDSLTLDVGSSETLNAAVAPNNATNLKVTWTSNEERVATVDESGKVEAVAPGTANITVTTQDGSHTATCAVTVTQPVTGVTLDPTSLSLFTGDTATLTATVEPENATNKNVTWSSDKPEVATVENGKVTAKAAGTATITATAEDDSNISATCTVTVTQSEYSISADTTALDFGSAYTGYTQPAAQTVTVKNAGNQSLTLNQPASTNSFEVGTLPKTVLAAGEAATFTVQPKAGLAVGTYSENITISDSGHVTLSIPATFTVRQYSSSGGTPSKTPSQQATDKIESAKEGSTVAITLRTGQTTLDKEVFEELAGRDVTLEISVPGGIMWTVNGQDIPENAKLSDLDLGVTLDASTIPVSVINTVTGAVDTIQLSLKHDGEFGFTMVLSAPLGETNAGYWANLYYYNTRTRALEFQSASKIATDGTASFPFSHASDYAIVIDTDSHESVELPFTDVPEGAWYEDAAAYVYKHGLMAGTSATTFAPDVTTSRAMIATILWRMAGSPVVNYAMNYTDVAQGQWCSEAIRWATSEGVVTGYGNGLFGTNDPITREQLATMLWRYAQTEGYDVSIGEDTNILSYTDVADLSEYAIPAMQWAVGAGIINGTGDGSTLTPQGQATRAQAAVMLQRFCEKYVIW